MELIDQTTLKSKNKLDFYLKLFLVLLLCGILPLTINILLSNQLAIVLWTSEPAHSSVEVLGGVIAVILAMLLYIVGNSKDERNQIWIISGLASMGILDIFHAMVAPGNTFVWLHSLAVFAGGVFFALVWLPEYSKNSNHRKAIPVIVAVSAIIISLYSIISPESVPEMIVEEHFSVVANFLNIVGGLGFLLSFIHFIMQYKETKEGDDILFASLSFLFGFAGVFFQMSYLWHYDWWFWHLLRLVAYFIILGYVLIIYKRSNERNSQIQYEMDEIFHSSMDSKLIVNKDFKIIAVNKTLSNLIKINGKEVSGTNCYDLLKSSICNTYECPINQLNRGIENFNFHMEIEPSSSSKIACDCSSRTLRKPNGEFIGLVESLLDVTEKKDAEVKIQRQTEILKGQNELNESVRGNLDLSEICSNIIKYLAKFVDAQVGVMYVKEKDDLFKLYGSYAYTKRNTISNEFKIGEGLVGQAALEKETIVFSKLPEEYVSIKSGLGEIQPKFIVIHPLLLDEIVIGVIELGSIHEFTKFHMDFLKRISENLAIVINSTLSRNQVASLLEETQGQAAMLEEQTTILEEQQEGLKKANQELEEHSAKLKQSQTELKAQQEELQAINEELEEKSDYLERQKSELSKKNEDLRYAQNEIQEKAREIEASSRYKSEFLANMSHELRTPLNSLLILSQDLMRNKKENLDEDQVESAEIIYNSGNDLLKLINEILDLSKIESGKVVLYPENMPIESIISGIKEKFKHVAEEKNIKLVIEKDKDLPREIFTDPQKLQQVLLNLVSNAVKFTDEGTVSVNITGKVDKNNIRREELHNERILAISIKDTGIGIPEDKRLAIFEAFQQADGSTSRKYGGTGLGLSISKELAKLLHGEIHLESELGIGTEFTLYIPFEIKLEKNEPETFKPTTQPAYFKEVSVVPVKINFNNSIEDDRDNIIKNDKVILVIEDDFNFSKTLYRFCHEKNFKCIHAGDGELGLHFADKYKPDAVILDINLPGIGGWSVLETLKGNSKTRHIPIHMMSAEEETIDAFKKGAVGYLTKPINRDDLDMAFGRIKSILDREIKRLLVVEDDENLRVSIQKLIGNGDVETKTVSTGKEALANLTSGSFDCVILDLNLPDISGFELLEKLDKMKEVNIPPIIVYTGKDLSWEEEYELNKYASSIIIKGVKSEERLLDETAIFLHRVVDKLPAAKRKMIRKLYEKEELLKDKHILIVDDDMRNVFAISKILEERGIRTSKAQNGLKALEVLQKQSDIDLVLMDIMMPVMDGYETMKKIRKDKKLQNLPIIALTAKAMKEDKQMCIDAGANDYMSKPVEIDRLLSLLRIWLYQ